MTYSTPSAANPSENQDPFSVHHISTLSVETPRTPWLIEDLWMDQGVGIIGGAPKCCKTFLAAEFAMAVASGRPALGRYAVQHPGPVLILSAEDNLTAMRRRFEHLAQAREVDLNELPLFLLDAPALHLNHPPHLESLRRTLREVQPTLLILDPFVRLVRGMDENSAGEVAHILGHLRQCQREYHLAILLVHHARKSPASHPSYALRGSGDFAAWSDHNLLLHRRQDRLTLTIEHRYASAPLPLSLHLEPEPAPHLCISNVENVIPTHRVKKEAASLNEEILAHLSRSSIPLTTTVLRAELCKRKQDVVNALHALTGEQRVRQTPRGWVICNPA